jgi:hypothetical protein
MVTINWEEFKLFKQHRPNPNGWDNFQLLLEFVRSKDTLMSPEEIYDILSEDSLSAQMLEKRGIADAAGLEDHLHKLIYR